MIVQTAHGGIDNVVSAMRAGAADFVVKPAGAERLQVSLRNAIAARRLAGEVQRLKRKHDGTLTLGDVITRSPAMKPVLRSAEKAAASTIPVLIEGESGTGKELIARAIHGAGARRDQAVRRGQLRRAAGEPGRSPFCSATRRAPSPAPPKSTPASSSRPTAARCSSTRSANCRCRRR